MIDDLFEIMDPIVSRSRGWFPADERVPRDGDFVLGFYAETRVARTLVYREVRHRDLGFDPESRTADHVAAEMFFDPDPGSPDSMESWLKTDLRTRPPQPDQWKHPTSEERERFRDAGVVGA